MNGFLSHKKLNGGLCIVLCAVLAALCLSSCNKLPLQNDETTAPATEPLSGNTRPDGLLRLPYAPEDSFNPYHTTSLMNFSLIGLVFRTLYKTDSAGARVYDLAVSETVSDTAIRVSLASDSVFSDGSLVTARDVVYSFNLAKESYLYSRELANISQAFILGDYSVEFTLASPDIFSLDSLIFPIVKQGTADTAQAVPTGSGLYTFSGSDEAYALTENLFAVDTVSFKKIDLVSVEDEASLIFMLETGQVDACFSDLSTGEASRIDAATVAVPMNNLVYLGFNPVNEEFLLSDVRRGISLFIDREKTVENAFYSRAEASVLPVNPQWGVIAESAYTPTLSNNADEVGAQSLLSDAGFGGVSEYGIRYGGNISMQYTLLYCSDTQFKTDCAQEISQTLTEHGIIITLKGLAFEEYSAAVENGEYDIYLGEVRLPYSMSLSAFFTADGAAYCAACISESLSNTYAGWRSGTVITDTFLETFYGEMPFIPLCMRSGVLCYSRDIKSSVTASRQNPYENISEWTVN